MSNRRTTVTTQYGTWTNHVPGELTPEQGVAVALDEFAEDYDVPALIAAYRAAIGEALPAGVSLCGDQFIGPWPIRTGITRAIGAAVASVDFWALAAAHEIGTRS